MPKNPVTDPITDQEIAFAHLILAGNMNDRRAAEAVGLNPDTAAYTKAKPRVRAYMIDHRAAVEAKLVDQEAESLRQLKLHRDQVRERILTRLWQIADLAPDMTRNSITGQVKALSMIIAIEGLIPDGKLTASKKQSPAPIVTGDFYKAKWNRPAEGMEPPDPVEAHVSEPEPEPPPRPANNLPSPINPFVYPESMSRVPEATGFSFNAHLSSTGPLKGNRSARRR
jgi:hypothetical protein